MSEDTTLPWYKDAVIYQAHVKAFYDSNNDGIGDFEGFTQRLDYLQELGVNALWLMPFYPSPLKDDGYDIARYRAVNPAYGSLKDFRRFVRACHERGIRLITELVINHTSDQHPWFQRARRARKASSTRDFYVWSDTDQLYRDARIIFCDTEKSNWTYDPEAKAYYWHRFYAHQPDLNFDNPRVLKEVLNAMRFWLDLGVDGLRLDAIPYLIERDGTTCENLPQTHALIKRIRAEIDAGYSDRMLLAEANQWPEDVAAYFGEGDECHMCYHFPLMPRMFMAIAQEDRHPITDIMRQTPAIPELCQWATFLRNHDELTLEMVTDRERDYLWNLYASDPRMRINQGIRRRLAPLLENNRAKIELLNNLLFSMPGTPILYYGDEIGMGDNIYLGDRNGVRTPMQWTSDRNGGFSHCDPERLYLPMIMDSVYGYGAINVEAQRRSSSSLFNWMRRLIALRKQNAPLTQGALSFLYPGNRKVIAFLRTHGAQTVLCVSNLSRSAQAVELDLAAFKGRVPVEMLGRSAFPPVGELPYLLTLPAYGFFWFALEEAENAPHWHERIAEAMPELITLVIRDNWPSLFEGRERTILEGEILPAFIKRQRWYAAKHKEIGLLQIKALGALRTNDAIYVFCEVMLEENDVSPRRYFLPLALLADDSSGTFKPSMLARLRRTAQTGMLYDATAIDGFVHALLSPMRAGEQLTYGDGRMIFHKTPVLDSMNFASDDPTRRLGGEQSNTSIVLGDKAILKIFRQVMSGPHPEIEIAEFLTTCADFTRSPPLLGWIEHVDAQGVSSALGVLQGFVRNQGDGWSFTQAYLDRILDETSLSATKDESPRLSHDLYTQQIEILGRRTAELHRAFCCTTDDIHFSAEAITARDVESWAQSARTQLDLAFFDLDSAMSSLNELDARNAHLLLACREIAYDIVAHAALCRPDASRTRIHGDYHLGQVLIDQNDFYILDFEGEPQRSLEERRVKTSPLKDVAGMLRSFEYAAWDAILRHGERVSADLDLAREEGLKWCEVAQQAFIKGYRNEIMGCASWSTRDEDNAQLLDLFLIEKAAYEIRYELANRPTWLSIPVRGLTDMLKKREKRSSVS